MSKTLHRNNRMEERSAELAKEEAIVEELSHAIAETYSAVAPDVELDLDDGYGGEPDWAELVCDANRVETICGDYLSPEALEYWRELDWDAKKKFANNCHIW